jgi:hypothetical protein
VSYRWKILLINCLMFSAKYFMHIQDESKIRTAYTSEHLSSPPVFSGVRVTRSLVLCVCFVDRCLSFCTFFYHCVVCSLISGFWLPFDIFKLFNNIINYTEMREECHNRGSNLWLSLEKHTVLVEANLALSSTWC